MFNRFRNEINQDKLFKKIIRKSICIKNIRKIDSSKNIKLAR